MSPPETPSGRKVGETMIYGGIGLEFGERNINGRPPYPEIAANRETLESIQMLIQALLDAPAPPNSEDRHVAYLTIDNEDLRLLGIAMVNLDDIGANHG